MLNFIIGVLSFYIATVHIALLLVLTFVWIVSEEYKKSTLVAFIRYMFSELHRGQLKIIRRLPYILSRIF